MNNPATPMALSGAEISPLNSLALISAFMGEYLNTMVDRPATRECVRMQVEDALRRVEQALQAPVAPSLAPIMPAPMEQPQEG